MRKLRFIFFALILVFVATAISAHALPQLSRNKKSSSKDKNTLTEAEIKELKIEWIDESTGQKYFVRVGFGLPKLTEATKAKAIKKGRVPYRFTVSLYRVEKGQTKAKLFKNDLHFYVLDSEGESAGKTITKSSMVMCPS